MDLLCDDDGSCVHRGRHDTGFTMANDTKGTLLLGEDLKNDAITSLLSTGSFLWVAVLSIVTVCAIYILILVKKKTAAMSALASMGKQSLASEKKNGKPVHSSRPNARQSSERKGRPGARPSLHRRSSIVGAISQFTKIDLAGEEEEEEKPSRGPRRWDDDKLDRENEKGGQEVSETSSPDGSSLRMSLTRSILSFNSSLQARKLKTPDIPHVPRPPLQGMHPDYPFENLVFQGGGAKGMIYGGVALALDEIGVTPYLKRFAGASAGSIMALAMALGLDGKQVEKELSALALDKILYQDSRGSGGQLSKLSSGLSFLNSLGVHDGTEVSHASSQRLPSRYQLLTVEFIPFLRSISGWETWLRSTVGTGTLPSSSFSANTESSCA